jgi:predicted HTH transcriptional regulator
MADQLDIFKSFIKKGQKIQRDIDWILEQQRVSRRDDPVSSHLAEREINRSGSRKTQQIIIYELVKMYPGSTSRELTQWCDLDRYQIARRLADLKNMGLVRQGPVRNCRIGGRPSVTWFICLC